MPILTTTDELAPRMRLHRPVFKNMQLVLPAGKVLNSADVDYLRRRCPGMSVHIEDPVLDELISFDDDTPEHQFAQKAQGRLIHLITDVQGEFNSRMSMKSMNCEGIENAVKGVLSYLEENPVMAVSLFPAEQEHHYIVSHAAQVFYLSLVLGNVVREKVSYARKKDPMRNAMSFAPPDLTPLGLAALLMDVAMWDIQELFTQSEPLTLDQCQRIREHTIQSAKALPEESFELVKLLIETHHENFDGSGYPFGLKGDEIHLYARILRITDAFSAATAQQVYHEARSPVRALWEMTWGPFRQFYDPVLLKLFGGLIQPFPIGSKLKLNSNQYAVVVRYGRTSPFLPEIVIAFDEEGVHLPRSMLVGPIKLDEVRDLRIVSFQGEDISDLYERDVNIESVSPTEFKTLYESMVTGCRTGALAQGAADLPDVGH